MAHVDDADAMLGGPGQDRPDVTAVESKEVASPSAFQRQGDQPTGVNGIVYQLARSNPHQAGRRLAASLRHRPGHGRRVEGRLRGALAPDDDDTTHRMPVSYTHLTLPTIYSV